MIYRALFCPPFAQFCWMNEGPAACRATFFYTFSKNPDYIR